MTGYSAPYCLTWEHKMKEKNLQWKWWKFFGSPEEKERKRGIFFIWLPACVWVPLLETLAGPEVVSVWNGRTERNEGQQKASRQMMLKHKCIQEFKATRQNKPNDMTLTVQNVTPIKSIRSPKSKTAPEAESKPSKHTNQKASLEEHLQISPAWI